MAEFLSLRTWRDHLLFECSLPVFMNWSPPSKSRISMSVVLMISLLDDDCETSHGLLGLMRAPMSVLAVTGVDLEEHPWGVCG